MATTYILESGDPYIRKRTEKGWTLDFVFNKDGFDWSGGTTFYYWGISGETEQKNYADNNLSFSFTDDGRVLWEAIHYKYDSCESPVYYNASGYTEVMCSGGTSNDFNLTITFERNIELANCDLCNFGGVNDLITGNTITIGDKSFLTGTTKESITIEQLNKKWYQNRSKRLGKLKVYLNGQKIYELKNWEEIIPSERQIKTISLIADGSTSVDIGEDIGTLVSVEVNNRPRVEGQHYSHEDDTSTIEFVDIHSPTSGDTITIVYYKTDLNPLVQVIGGGTDGINNVHTGNTSFDILYVKYLEEPMNALAIKKSYKAHKLNYEIVECSECNDAPFNYTDPPTPTPTPTLTPTPTPTPTTTPTLTPTPTPSPTPTLFPTLTPTPTPTLTSTPTVTPTSTPFITPTPYPFTTQTPSGFTFDADYIVVTYAFTDGADLDTRTRISSPNIGQNDTSSYLGWCRAETYPADGNPILTWSGDNTGQGFESVLINLIEFKLQYPSQSGSTITIDMNAMWYGSAGSNPVVMDVMMYKGGTMSLVQEVFMFANVGYSGIFGVASTGTIVTLQSQTCEDQELVATLQYNLTTKQGQFI